MLITKIKTNFHRSQQTIEMIYGSILSRGEIAPRTKADRSAKIFFDVIEHLQISPNEYSSNENHRRAGMMSKELSIKVLNETNDKISGLLQYEYPIPNYDPAMTLTHIQSHLDFWAGTSNITINWAQNATLTDESRFPMIGDPRRSRFQM
jgi:hypothetical protein